MYVKVSDEIEKFVSRVAMRDWWNQGVHETSLSNVLLLGPMQHSGAFFRSCTDKQLAGQY